MDAHTEKSASIKSMSERPGDIRFDANEGGAAPRVGTIARCALT